MQSAINISTLSGVRLDVYPTATIEVNMGGISLLSLADRTSTYTNSFSLPRTPTNEFVFEYASQPTRNNRPSIDVVVSKGLFQRQGLLKVQEFGKEYKCSIIYTGIIELLKQTTLDFLEAESNVAENDTYEYVIQQFCDILNYETRFKVLRTNSNTISSGGGAYYKGNIVIKLSKLLELISSHLNITINGSLLTNVDFLKCYMLLPNFVMLLETFGPEEFDYGLSELKLVEATTTILLSDIISQISLLFMADAKFSNNTISLNLISFTNSIALEGFGGVNKKMYSGLLKNNYVKYTNEGADEYFASDNVIGEGVGGKELVKLKTVIPATDSVGYITNDYTKLINKIIIFTTGATNAREVDMFGAPTSVLASITDAAVLNLSSFYSSILNPIFANPIILEATRYIDPLTADNIMTTRVINSVQLGGRYWVDSMAYNLTTGQSKLTLIKIP